VGSKATLLIDDGKIVNRKIKGLTLVEMMVASALSIILFTVVAGFLFTTRKLHHYALIMSDFSQRGQLLTQLLYQDLVSANPSSIIFDENNIRMKLHKKYHGKQQIVIESLYVARGALFEKVNNDRSEALISGIDSLSAYYDAGTNNKGVMIKFRIFSKYSQKSRPWFVYFALGE